MIHGDLCVCEACNYERIVKVVKEKYKTNLFKSMYNADLPPSGDDPFPPNTRSTHGYYFCGDCQNYHPEGFSHNTRTGRFKVSHPNTEQKPRTPRHPGQYRRVKDAVMNVINWQYKPWPSAEWRTYFSITTEELSRFVIQHGNNVTVAWHSLEASKALSQERFYKIERVDETA